MKNLESDLEKTIGIIFENYELDKLNEYEKRKIIFEYLSNNLSYDYDLLTKIKSVKINNNKISRDPIKELSDVVNNKKGICNSISQYYKLLLEKIGIKSYCVICDDGTKVKHQLNLVYSNDNDSYSFDDITSVIVNRGTTEDYFDYDLDFANSVNQGNKTIIHDQSFVILPEYYINYLVGRENSLSENLTRLPDNIVSIKMLCQGKHYF